MRDQRDPACIGNLLLGHLASTPILKAADELDLYNIPNYSSTETSQTAAQRAYREKHEKLAAQGYRASARVLAQLDGAPIDDQEDPSDAAEPVVREEMTQRDPTPNGQGEASVSDEEAEKLIGEGWDT